MHILFIAADMQNATRAVLIVDVNVIAQGAQAVAAIDRDTKRLFQIDPRTCIGAITQEPQSPGK